MLLARPLVILFFVVYYFNWLDVNFRIFTLTVRETILMMMPLFLMKMVFMDRDFRARVAPFYLYFSIVQILSIIYLLINMPYSFVALIKRSVVQFVRHLLIGLELFLGFRLFQFISPRGFFKLQLNLLTIFALFGLYQVIAYNLGLPLWGLGAERSDLAVSESGLRPNSFLGEPKDFAVFLDAAICYVYFSYRRGLITRTRFILSITLFFFLLSGAQSGNGMLGLAMVFVVRYLLGSGNLYQKILSVTFMGGFLIWLWENLEDLLARENLKAVVMTAKAMDWTTLLYMSDDLVLLVILAFDRYWYFLPTGFGFGMVTFYARDFLYLATWTKGNVIDPNISLLSSIANYGILFLGFIFIFNTKVYLMRRDNPEVIEEVNLITEWMYYSFLLGALISGANPIILFVSLGYMIVSSFEPEEWLPESAFVKTEEEDLELDRSAGPG